MNEQSSNDLIETEERTVTETPQEARAQAPKRRGWLLPAVAIVLAALGVVVLVVALITHLRSDGPDAPAVPQSADQADAPIGGAGDGSERAGGAGAPENGESDTAEASAVVSELADPAWVSQTADRLDIPRRALAAYAGASLAAAQQHPGCHLGWNTLAAIGYIESGHGTIHDSRIGADGVATPDIIGIPLDGGDTQHIPDTDGGELDGDTEVDRAVGPMQFIPETWRHYGRDGSGDGIIDPQNIDDAALSAAWYLCEAGGDLTIAENWITAVDAYNPTVEYNNLVADAANRYAE